MATASKISLSTSLKPEYYTGNWTEESARKTSELLQENHETHHIFFNKEGFHNHIVHHLLTLFALGASPEDIQKGYRNNASYQRPPFKVDQKLVEDFSDPAKFKKALGREKYYHDLMVFFQQQIEKKDWEAVVNEFLFSGDERAEDLLVRTFSGFLHPLIHLGFGIEFGQPAIIAEALAQACAHDNWIGKLYFESEKHAKQNGNPDKTLVELLEEALADKELVDAPHSEDSNKIRDGILKRAPENMIRITSQYVVREDQLEEKTAEMINFAAYFAGASQDPEHIPKIDFFHMHCVNCSIFFSNFLKQPMLSTATKIRLLEWKARTDLALYVSRGSPKLYLDRLKNYQAKQPSSEPWPSIVDRVIAYPDDGHASKLIRALLHGKEVSQNYAGKENFKIQGETWDRLGQLTIDSVGAAGPTWVRSAGFPEAWSDVPKLESKL